VPGLPLCGAHALPPDPDARRDGVSSPPDGVPDWHALIRAAVRECAATYELQARTGPVAPEALEAILSRTTVLIAQRLEGHDPRLLAALLPGMVRTMLKAFVELLDEGRDGAAH